jgi:hypothetical protein
VLGGLALLLVMVLVSISYSNKLATINDETAAIKAETDTHRSVATNTVITPDEVGAELASRTLLVGGLAETRFPWGSALYDLSRSLPPDVTLDSITGASTGTAGTNPKGEPISGANMALTGCTSGWMGYSRFMSWLQSMPGVSNVVSTSSTVGSAQSGDDGARIQNCGPTPLTFALSVYYDPLTVDLKGLPKPEAEPGASGASGATGSSSVTGTPAAASTPTAQPAN